MIIITLALRAIKRIKISMIPYMMSPLGKDSIISVIIGIRNANEEKKKQFSETEYFLNFTNATMIRIIPTSKESHQINA